MKYIVYVTLIFLMLSCNGRRVSEQDVMEADDLEYTDEEVEFVPYENEFYSLEYPEDWTCEEDIRDKMEGYEAYTGNEKMTLQHHEVCIIGPTGLGCSIVRSNFHFDSSVEEYANMSIWSKGLENYDHYQRYQEYQQNLVETQIAETKMKYIDYWRKDSVEFAGQKAVMLAFEIERQDTFQKIIQIQYIVQNTKGDTFYVNSSFYDGDKESEYIGYLILHSFTLK